MDDFITEGNVEIYLSGAYETFDPERRETLLRLLADEEAKMGRRREHLEQNGRRLADCADRVRRQRELVSELQSQQQNSARAEFILQTFERCLALMLEHDRRLSESDLFKL